MTSPFFYCIIAVTTGKINDEAVTTDKIADESITPDKLNPLTVSYLSALNVSTSSFSSFPQTINDSNITENMRVIECTWSNPGAITSDISWTTTDGSITLSGSISGSTTANLILISTR